MVQVQDVASREAWRDARRRDKEGEWLYDDSETIRVWDTVENHWTEPLARDVAEQLYLRQVQFKCSGCDTTDLHDNGIANHVSQLAQGIIEHEGAELVPFTRADQDGTRCTGCGGEFMLRKQQGQRHLERFGETTRRAHIGAEQVTIRRYTLEPPVLTLPVNGAVGTEVNQEQRSPRQPSGRRRRGRRGGRRH